VTAFLLVRHAAHDNVGKYLAGRTPGIRLGQAGRAQAARLAERLKREPIEQIWTSPRERTQETAEAIASAKNLPAPTLAEELDEIDFGAWSGRTFDDLTKDPAFRRWNEIRSLARTPSGEGMLDVQSRVLRLMQRIGAKPRAGILVLVSHADVIKAAVSYCLGLPIDSWSRFEISPASITSLILSETGAELKSLNEVIW